MKSVFLAVALLAPAIAHADECPTDQRRTPQQPYDAASDYQGVTAGVSESVPLDDFEGLAGRKLRLRRIDVAVGGVIAWHDHADRPALATIISGEMTEYRADCAVGIVHGPGDTVEETTDVAHWWRNESDEPASLLLTDIAR